MYPGYYYYSSTTEEDCRTVNVFGYMLKPPALRILNIFGRFPLKASHNLAYFSSPINGHA